MSEDFHCGKAGRRHRMKRERARKPRKPKTPTYKSQSDLIDGYKAHLDKAIEEKAGGSK